MVSDSSYAGEGQPWTTLGGPTGQELALHLSTLGSEPISEDRPTGADARYDPAYDELQTEVDKLSAPAAATPVNWEKVSLLATDILTNTSKDLLVASYLAVALIHTRGNDGCTVGLKLYLDLIESYWDELYPQKDRLRGRIRALEWWLEKTQSALKQATDLSFLAGQHLLVMDILNRLDDFLGGHLEDAPSLVSIKDYFIGLTPVVDDTLERETPASLPSANSEEKQEQAGIHPPHETQALSAAQGINSTQEIDRTLSDGLMKISAASFGLWQQDHAAPQAYRLARLTAWCAIDELPPSANGRTRIAPPPSQVKDLLFELENNLGGDTGAEALLQAAETRLPQHIFWIDLNRLAAEALVQLGAPFARAHQTVCQETAFLLHRLPGLEELSFCDGSPFATPETRRWLKGITLRFVRPEVVSLIPVPALAETGMEARIEEKMTELHQLVGTGKLIEALEIAQLMLQFSTSRREHLLWRLALSRMLVDTGESRLALPHLEQVLDDITEYGLALFDPSLALQGLQLAWLAFQSQPEQKSRDRAQEVLHQIGRIDLPEMARLIQAG
jgi:type VI secretion system protein VasJ